MTETQIVHHRLPNLARRLEPAPHPSNCEAIDKVVCEELRAAGIKSTGFEALRGKLGTREVPTKFFGELCGWSFERAWYYWVAKGPGIPPDKAEEFHATWGQEVRVNGDCACRSPLEWNHGFAVGNYHIDTREGLVAFADLLRSIYRAA